MGVFGNTRTALADSTVSLYNLARVGTTLLERHMPLITSRKRFLSLVFGCILLVASTAEISAQPVSSGETGSLFVVNLWSEAVDVQYGDKPLFSIANLGSGQPSAIIETAELEGQTLYFKSSSQKVWRFLQDSAGKPEKVYVLPYALTIMKIAVDGTVSVFRTAKPQGPGPFVAFLNTSDKTIDRLSLMDQQLVPVAQTLGLGPSSITSFVAVNPGTYAAEAVSGSDVTRSLGQETGTVGFVRARSSVFYLVTSGTDPVSSGQSAQSFAIGVWDIGPISSQSADGSASP